MTYLAAESWDGESYCSVCKSWPAVIEQPVGMVGDLMLTELICVTCAMSSGDT
jgi:hypothetical protein